MLPLIVFAVFFGVALNRIPAERRLAVVRTAEGIAHAMLQIIAWVLVGAPAENWLRAARNAPVRYGRTRTYFCSRFGAGSPP